MRHHKPPIRIIREEVAKENPAEELSLSMAEQGLRGGRWFP